LEQKHAPQVTLAIYFSPRVKTRGSKYIAPMGLFFELDPQIKA
jgi:hypothetical protein